MIPNTLNMNIPLKNNILPPSQSKKSNKSFNPNQIVFIKQQQKHPNKYHKYNKHDEISLQACPCSHQSPSTSPFPFTNTHTSLCTHTSACTTHQQKIKQKDKDKQQQRQKQKIKILHSQTKKTCIKLKLLQFKKRKIQKCVLGIGYQNSVCPISDKQNNIRNLNINLNKSNDKDKDNVDSNISVASPNNKQKQTISKLYNQNFPQRTLSMFKKLAYKNFKDKLLSFDNIFHQKQYKKYSKYKNNRGCIRTENSRRQAHPYVSNNNNKIPLQSKMKNSSQVHLNIISLGEGSCVNSTKRYQTRDRDRERSRSRQRSRQEFLGIQQSDKYLSKLLSQTDVHPDIVLNGNSINNENGINNGNVKGKINLNIGRSVSSINLSKNKRASFSHQSTSNLQLNPNPSLNPNLNPSPQNSTNIIIYSNKNLHPRSQSQLRQHEHPSPNLYSHSYLSIRPQQKQLSNDSSANKLQISQLKHNKFWETITPWESQQVQM